MKTESPSAPSGKTNQSWRFFRAGGVDQVLIRTGEDIARIPELDLKLWFAIAMPTTGVDIAPETLAFIDTDKDGRIRPPEVIQAVRWAQESFLNLDDLLTRTDRVPLDSIRSDKIRLAAKNILKALGKPDAREITLDEVSRMEEVFAKTSLNGDGIVPPESAEDPEIAKALTDIVTTVGGLQDRNGKPGVDTTKLEAFFAEVDLYLKWKARLGSDASLLPCGAETSASSDALAKVRAKIEDYFSRGKLAAYDPRCAESLNRTLAEYAALSAKDISAAAGETAAFPLAYVSSSSRTTLPLAQGINPAWDAAIAEFRRVTMRGILGRDCEALTFADWETILKALAPYNVWAAEKPVTHVEALGDARLAELASGNCRERIAALIAEDLALKEEFEEMHSVEKLVRYRRDLVRVLTNFVNFAEFYQKRDAVFLSGNLYLDARNCHICLDVADAAAHATLAGLAGMYLAYCEVTRPGGKKKTIVAAFTDGDSDNLMVGRNGVYFDRAGNDWDARVTKIITNPISLREAFWSPYKKLQRFLDEFIAKRAAGSDAVVNTKLSDTADIAASAGKKDAATAVAGKKIDVGTVAALGVALGAIGATLSALATGLMGLSWWQLPFVFAGIILLISTPSMVMAWLKLKRRNIAPVLDANGWAINTRAKINAPFGAAMTDTAKIPAHIAGRLIDPFAEKKSYWQVYVAIAALIIAAVWVLNSLGKLYTWTDGLIGSEPKVTAPAHSEEPPPAASTAPGDTAK